MLLYLLARAVVAPLRILPLRCVARLGRAAGGMVYWLDARHRRVALENLTLCFGGEKRPAEIRGLAKENFRRLGENHFCAIKTASMSREALARHFEIVGGEPLRAHLTASPPRGVVLAVGHFGNFELYARYGQFLPPIQCATTYRALKQAGLNRLVQELRRRSGCLYFERRTEGAALKAAMRERPLLLGLLCDQHPGDRGLTRPFLGRDCRHSTAPALFALRYGCVLTSGICYRVGLARWRIETGPEIPTHENGAPRSPEAITADVVRTIEAAVRRDPANWFWVHDRWKARAPRRES
jgi:lauroyl/myristoyl acyltransferase